MATLSSDAVIDKVSGELGTTHPELIHSSLSTEEEERLREVFTAQ